MAAPALVPIIFEDSDDEELPPTVCTYIFVKGKKKGEMCGKKCKEKYCSVHKTRKGIARRVIIESVIVEVEIENEELNEDGLTARQQSALDYAMCLEKKIPSHVSVDIVCLANFIRYICPISINFPSMILHKLINDTHVRNGFEIRKGLDKSVRPTWESNLFNKYYDKSSAFDRVKYGSIKTNPLSMMSNSSTLGYGDAMFILKDEVKRRCTMTPGDSSIFAADNVYTFDQIPEMLMKHPHVKAHMQSCYQAYEREDRNGSKDASYIEVQIHGELALATGISKLIISSKDEKISVRLYFCRGEE